MPRERHLDPVSGRLYELRRNRWVDITPTPEQAAAERSGPLGAFGVQTAITGRSLGRGLAETLDVTLGRIPAMTARGLEKVGLLEEGVAEAIRESDVAARAARIDAQERDDELQRAMSEARPVASFLGAAAPYVATAPLGAAGTAGNLGRLVGQEAALGAAEGFFARPGSMAERVQGAALGGALGGGGAGALGMASRVAGRVRRGMESAAEASESVGDATLRIDPIEFEAATDVPELGRAADRLYRRSASAAPAGEGLTAHQANMVRVADRLKLALTTADRTQNTQLRQLKATLESNPVTSGPFQELREFNQSRLNALTADAFSDYVDVAADQGFDQSMLGSVRTALGREFSEIASDIGTVDLDPTYLNQLADIHHRHKNGVGRLKPVRKFIRQIRELTEQQEVLDDAGNVTGYEGGRIRGDEFLEARSNLTAELSELTGGAMRGTYELIEALDMQVMRALARRGDMLTMHRYQGARDAWRLLDALDVGNVVGKTGDISAPLLYNQFQRRYRHEFKRSSEPRAVASGVSNVMNAVKVINAFPDIVGDSGTATRMFGQNFLDAPIRTTLTSAGQALTGRAVMRASNTAGFGGFAQGVRGAPPPVSRRAARAGQIGGVAVSDALIDADRE